VVVVREDLPGNKQLVGYVIGESGRTEQRSQEEQVSEWQSVFDEHLYGKEEEVADPAFNIVGWANSYDGKSIPALEMREWLDDTIERLTAMKPRRVLEIGCGSGMILFGMAPRCQEYWGTDFSSKALGYIERHLGPLGIPPERVKLLHREASDFTGTTGEKFSGVVLNSVIQYFPDIDYLVKVLERALEVVEEGGFIFLGDVRSLPLAKVFGATVQVARADESDTVKQLRQRMDQDRVREKELLIMPGFFHALKQKLGRVGRVEIAPKHGKGSNELMLFRFQVILHVGTAREAVAVQRWIDWAENRHCLETIKRQLEGGGAVDLGIRNVTNRRLSRSLAVLKALEESTPECTVGELHRKLKGFEIRGIAPDDWKCIGEETGYQVELDWSRHDDEGAYDVILWKGERRSFVRGPEAVKSWREYANNPLYGKLARRLVPELKSYVSKKVPKYMALSEVVVLDKLPLTENGKVDRKALPAPEAERVLTGEFVGPRDETERKLVVIWMEVMGIKRVGIHDDFFELGGHSLLATQVISRLRQVFEVDLPLRSMFESPTIAGLGIKIQEFHRNEAALQSSPPTKRNSSAELLLSYAQERLWFIDQLRPGSAAYSLPGVMRIGGALDVRALEQAINEITARHEVLRTTFAVNAAGRTVQVIQNHRRKELPIVDLAELPVPDQSAESSRLIREEGARPFDLARDAVVRTWLLQLDAKDHVVLYTLHHIAADGWSMGIINRELGVLYDAFSRRQSSPLMELPIQYADYAVWQRGWLQGRVLEKQLKYWKAQLTGISALQLPADHFRPAMQSFNGGIQEIIIAPAVLAALKELSQREGVTLFMTVLAGLQVLLNRYSGQEDIAIGSLIANRNRSELENLIGFFVNTLVMRVDSGGDPTVVNLIKRVKEATLGAYEHQDLPFEKLVEELQPERDLSRNPLVQVIVQWLNAPDEGVEMEGVKLRPVGSREITTRFDLEVHFQDHRQGLRGWIIYNRDLFEGKTVERMARHLEQLLKELAGKTGRRISELEMLEAKELTQMLVAWNDTRREYRNEGCVHEMFEEQVERTPETVAVIGRAERLTYRQLNEQANQVGRCLTRVGVGPEVLVGLCVERGVDMVVGLLAILKAGGAYVPLDPNYPRERLAYMLQNAGAKVLVTQTKLLSVIPEIQGQVICLDRSRLDFADPIPRARATPANLAYVIYTSGSTGRPKGVALEHRPLANLIRWQMEHSVTGPGDRTLQFASFSFDVSFQEIFSTWCGGGTLVLIDEESRRDPNQLLQLINEQRVNRVFLPFVALNQLTESLTGQGQVPRELREIISAGEQVSVTGRISAFFQRLENCALYNQYGPTESHVVTGFGLEGPIENWPALPPIGRPIANAEVYLLDKYFNPVPLGSAGELYIGGACLARNYCGDAEATASNFVPHLFATVIGQRLYRSGDLARYQADGNIEYLGRKDQQVKIRGFRVELGEIESVLGRHPAVSECVVTAWTAETSKQLAAYVVPKGGQHATSEQLRDHIREQLPEYMVPSVFVRLEKLPLTPSGKVDRKGLAIPDVRRSGEDLPLAARTVVEQIMAELWQDVLKLGQVGIEDNFFDLGGHSLLATQVVSRVRQIFEVELPLRSLFETPTVAGLSERVEKAWRKELKLPVPPLRRVGREREMPLSYAQERLWFIDQLHPGNTAYNMLETLWMGGALRVEFVEKAINEILRRHEVLRTTFDLNAERKPVSLIQEHRWRELVLIDLAGLPEAERGLLARRLIKEEAVRVFNLKVGPLIRTVLLRLGRESHVIIYVLHHIVTDGWSNGIMVREFRQLYEAFCGNQLSPLAELPVQYVDFAVWQRDWLQGDVLKEHVEYWRKQLAGAPELIELPTDRPRQPVQSFRGAHLAFGIPQEVAERLKRLCLREGATLYMGLQAAFQLLLHRYSGQEDIVISAGIGNRNHAEAESLIGCFINTVLMRTDVSGNPDFRELLKRVKAITLRVFAYQELPFELLVEQLRPQRSLSHNPLTQAMLVLLNAPADEAKRSGLEMPDTGDNSGMATQLDLTLHVTQTGTGLQGGVTYNRDLFDQTTIKRMMQSFVRLLSDATERPDYPTGELPLISEEEQERITSEWNQSGREFAGPFCLHERTEEQAHRSPEIVAVICGEQEINYAELNRRANRLAHYLRAGGIAPGSIVGLCVERSVEMVVAILGILKAGAAYTPLDPAHPQERIERMLWDAGVNILLTQSGLEEAVPDSAGRRICLDCEKFEGKDERNAQSGVTPEDLAYVIYTSGSTGKPKGIEIRHRGVTNNIMDLNRRFGVGAGDKVLGLSALSFDMSVYELLGMIECGATVIIPEGTAGREPLKWAEYILEHQVTIWNSAPALLKMLIEAVKDRPELWPRSLRLVLLGGDWVPLNMPDQIKEMAPGVKVIVMGGATEASIHSSIYEVEQSAPEWRSIPYGRPMANQKLYVLNRQMQAAPVGVSGELYLGGIGLARGYHERPDLTAEKFVPNPFARKAGERLYRTGDLVKAHADGLLELLGRIDFQVKIRGYRIELGEIESALRRCAGVKEAILMAREDAPGKQQLVGYLLPAEGARLNETELRQESKRYLPEYMVPAALVILESIPLTPNGKIDRKSLPVPEMRPAELPVVAPRTPVEEVLKGIFCEVLGLEQVGVEDHFFELGGHSLLATQVVSRVLEFFPVKLPLRVLFEQPTIAQLGGWLEVAGEAAGADVTKIAEVVLQVNEMPEPVKETALTEAIAKTCPSSES
jgi:amino acid adenylation domain-containing protein